MPVDSDELRSLPRSQFLLPSHRILMRRTSRPIAAFLNKFFAEDERAAELVPDKRFSKTAQVSRGATLFLRGCPIGSRRCSVERRIPTQRVSEERLMVVTTAFLVYASGCCKTGETCGSRLELMQNTALRDNSEEQAMDLWSVSYLWIGQAQVKRRGTISEGASNATPRTAIAQEGNLISKKSLQR